jgi:hypothetical protein
MSENIKTLVCVIASTRANQLTWGNFRRFVIDELQADLALCISCESDYDYENPFWRNSTYRFTIPEYNDYYNAFELIESFNAQKSNFNWNELLTIGNNLFGGVRRPGIHGTGGILLFFKSLLLKNIEISGLLNKYDRFVITRSDFYWMSPHPTLDLLDPNFVWVPDGQAAFGFTDRHVVLSSKNIVEYLTLLDLLLTGDKTALQSVANRTGMNLESFYYSYYNQKDDLKTIKRFPYIMCLVRGESDDTKSVIGTYHPRLRCYVKNAPEYTDALKNSRRFKSRGDWQKYFREYSPDRDSIKTSKLHEYKFPDLEKNYTLATQDGRKLMYDTNLTVNYSEIDGTEFIFDGLVFVGDDCEKNSRYRPVLISKLTDKLYFWLESNGGAEFHIHNEIFHVGDFELIKMEPSLFCRVREVRGGYLGCSETDTLIMSRNNKKNDKGVFKLVQISGY